MRGAIREKAGIPGWEELNDGKCLRRDWPNLSDFSEIWLDIHKKFPAAGKLQGTYQESPKGDNIIGTSPTVT